jgi:hypothetical protein
MSDPLDLVGTAAGSAGAGAGLFWLGRAAVEWVRAQRQPPASVSSTRPKSPTPPPPARCSDDVEQQVAELHTIMAQRDAEGASVVLRALRETAENTRAMGSTLTRLGDTLSSIDHSLRPRRALGSQPGDAE